MNPLIRIPKPNKPNFGLSLKRMGKYQYWVALWWDGRKWKAEHLRGVTTVEEARAARDVFYAKLTLLDKNK